MATHSEQGKPRRSLVSHALRPFGSWFTELRRIVRLRQRFGAIETQARRTEAAHPENDAPADALRFTREAYHARIETLRGHAASDEIEVQPASEQDFWAFVESLSSAPRAEVVLMDNGNFRAVWEDAEQSRLAIQFMGAQRGEYVIFKRRAEASEVSRVAGIDTLDGIKRQIRSFDLMPTTSA